MKKKIFLLAFILALALPALSFSTEVPSGLAVCDMNNDGSRDLSDVSLFASCVDTFDANGDGIHDITDVSEYASNKYNNSWCQTSFNCTATAMTNSSYISSTNPTGLAVCDINNDGLRNLSDVTLYASCVSTFDVNSDGIHDLTDVSLYASNNQSNTWCQTNFRCTPNSGVDLTASNITTYPVIPKVGEDVYVSFFILNSGNSVLTNTAGILNNSRYFQDFTTGMPNVISNVSPANPLNPGETTRITWKGSFTSAGTKTLQATVDNANELLETNENNNNYSTTINVSGINSYAVCDINGDSSHDLVDVGLFAGCQSTFDVNNDGVHNLTDISLYSSNYQSSSWCRANFRCEPSYNRYNYSGYRMSLDRSSYTIEDTAILTLEPFVMGSSHSVDLYGRVNPVGGESSKFLIRAGINIDSSLDIPISLRGFARRSDTNYEYSLLICSSTNGCVMGSTNSTMITILAGETDENDDLPQDGMLGTKVKVCHVVGNGKTNTLEVASDAVAAHIAHGDKLGACEMDVRPVTPVSTKLIERVRGRILLQVQKNGEAWYVNPKDDKRFYLKDGATAYSLMREAGLGISNSDLAKIPMGLEDRFSDHDTDGDGLGDKLEQGLGTDINKSDTDGDGVNDRAEILARTNPLGTGNLSSDSSLVNRLKGRIVLQVQSRGEAWYIDPSDGKRYYMRDGEAAYQIMRFRSLGITDGDLAKIAE